MSKINHVLFMGSKQLGLRVLKEIYSLAPKNLIGVVTIDDTNDTRTKYGDFKYFAQSQELELHIANNRKHSEQIVKELNPDLCFVVGWYWLIGEATFMAS
ncbi:hypothetical protein JXL19_04605 [bacterium]|nr:hypothetical protein [bacterium]